MQRTRANPVLAILVVIAACFMALGCHHNINTQNPQVVFVDSLDSGATVCQLAATGLVAANETVNGLEDTEPDYYAHTKPLLGNMARKVKIATAAIRAAQAGDTSADWKGAVAAIAAEIKPADLTIFGFKNPQSAKAAQLGMATLVGILESIPATFGSPKP